MDILEAGQQWLAGQLNEHASRLVSYERGNQTVLVKATLGRSLLKLDDGLGNVRVEWTDADFLIRAEDLVLAGIQVVPERGDVIRAQIGIENVVFEVMAPGSEPPWRYADPSRVMLRIHAKQVDTTLGLL